MASENVIDSVLSIRPILDRVERAVRDNVKSGPIYIYLSRTPFIDRPAPKPSRRTIQQNKALHLFFDQLAEKLNDSGYDMRKVLKEGVEIPWNRQSVKEHLWRPIQQAVTGESSTTKPASSEYTKIYEVLSRHLSQKLGVYVEWPSEESLIRKAREKDIA